MLDRLFIAVTTCIATASLVYFGSNQPTADASPVAATMAAAAATKPQCDAAEDGKCECFDKGGCKCAAGKQCAKPLTPKPVTTSGVNMRQEHILIPAKPAVKAAPIAAPKYTQPQPVKAVVTSPSHPRHIVATHVLRWQPSYGPFGRERGGQWVRVPVNQARQYRAPQPTYRTYRSCANGSCR